MTAQNTNTETTSTKPTHTLRKKVGYGKQTSFESIGVAWAREDEAYTSNCMAHKSSIVVSTPSKTRIKQLLRVANRPLSFSRKGREFHHGKQEL